MNTTQNDSDQDRKLPWFHYWIRAALAVYTIGIFIAAPFALSLLGYGLAHASESAISGLFLVAALLVAIAVGAPLALLLRKRSPVVTLLKLVGATVMSIGAVCIFKLLYIFVIETSWMTWQFSHATDAVKIIGVSEEPLYIQDRQVGIKITRDAELTRPVELDLYGEHVRELLRDIYVGIAQPNTAQALSPFSHHNPPATIQIDGRPLDEVLATTSTLPNAKATLPKGHYRTTRAFYLWGLDGSDATVEPCRQAGIDTPDIKKQHEAATNLSLYVGSMTSLGLKYRLGYRRFSTPTLPIKYRYEHSTWMHGLPQLPIETCLTRQERKASEEQAKLTAQAESWYATGDKRLSVDDNPLYKEICAGDVSAVRSRLAESHLTASQLTAGAPSFDLGGKIYECTLTKRNMEMFALLLPILYTHSSERSMYCSVLEFIHSRRDVALMETIVALKLPLLCTDAEHPVSDSQKEYCQTRSLTPNRCIQQAARGSNAWRLGLSPRDEKGETQVNFNPASRTDSVQWLQFLLKQGIPICDTAADHTNLLQELVGSYPTDAIEFLLKAGCDPHVAPPLENRMLDYAERPHYTAATQWLIRTTLPKQDDARVASIDPARSAIVSKAMGDISSEEINQPSPNDGRTLLHWVGSSLPYHPQVFRYLLSRGAKVSAADQYGGSWFNMLRFSPDEDHAGLVLLDMMSVEQLRELASPVIVATGAPGHPLEKLQAGSNGELRAYLCRRGASEC